MKIFNFNCARDLLQNSKVDYAQVQESCQFQETSISEDQIIDDIVSSDPNKSNKFCLPNRVMERVQWLVD
jgi:hypothetical protein